MLLPAQKCTSLAMIICNFKKRWLTNDNQNSISLRVVHCRLPWWPQLHFLSAVVILENHSFSLCLITAIICEIFFSSKLQLSSRHWNSFCSEPRVRVSVYKSRICSGSPKNCTFAQLDLGQRFDGPGNARRIGMTGEVCTELRVAPKQQHGERPGERGEREHRPGVQRAKSASSHYDDPRTSRSFTRSPTAELQQTRSVPAPSPRTPDILSVFCCANRRLHRWAD